MNTLSRQSDHMQTKEKFNHSILKVNSNRLLLFNQHKLNTTLQVLKDSEKQYLIEKEKLHISNDKIKDCIKKHHDRSLQNHSDVIKTLQLLQQHCQFKNIKQHIKNYIKKCLSC